MLGVVVTLCVGACADDAPGSAASDSDGETTTGEPDTSSSEASATPTVTSIDPSMSSTSEGSSSTGDTEDTGEVCEPDFLPLPPDALPRCASATQDCWTECPTVDPHACTSACAAADRTPAYDADDGSSVDCGRCINRMFGVCWHQSCPAQVEATRCCVEASGCDPECLMYGPCDDEDLDCLRQACGPELAAQSSCLQRSGGLAECRIENGGVANRCFAPPR